MGVLVDHHDIDFDGLTLAGVGPLACQGLAAGRDPCFPALLRLTQISCAGRGHSACEAGQRQTCLDSSCADGDFNRLRTDVEGIGQALLRLRESKPERRLLSLFVGRVLRC